MNTPYRDPEIVHCPLCDVPHRPAAERCDTCGQPLHAPIDPRSLEQELARRKLNIGLAIAAIAAMIALNLACFGQVGGFVVVLAPIGWLLVNFQRYWAIRRKLAIR